jgi:hypothetical protein
VLLLTGSALLEIAGETITLTSGDYLFIPAHTRHRVLQTIPGPAAAEPMLAEPLSAEAISAESLSADPASANRTSAEPSCIWLAIHLEA